jgi:hypothetical protein
MRNNHIAVPCLDTYTTAVHCAVPIAPTLSRHVVTYLLRLPFRVLFDSLAPTCINWLRARNRVSRDTESPISSNNRLTATSPSYRDFTILLEVSVSKYILPQLLVAEILPSFSSPHRCAEREVSKEVER